MSKRALKLPDGGTFDLPIPTGFGAPIFALNDQGGETSRAWLPYLFGAGVGVLLTWAVRRWWQR